MAINKVEFGGQTLIDLTEDTVTPSTLMAGETAHDRSGAAIVGTATGGSSTLAQLTDVNLTNLSDEQIIKYNSTTQKWENTDAGGSDIVHLTKAEYDALPDTKLSDNKIYMLEDVPSSDTEDKHIILDSEDVVYPQRSFLQFTGNASITDDETNNKTIVDITGGGAEIIEMTQAEYDALPDTKLTDGVLRAIKDEYSPSDTKMVGLAECYSTTEKQVGCYVDGKPLYQKTITSDVSQSTGSISIATGISDIDETVYFNGSWSYGTNSSWIPLPFSDDSNQTSISDSIVKIRNIRKSDGVLTLYIGNDFTGTYAVNKIRVTLQYTKTTDTAGSGTWTPEGVPAHQYDGNEKVVGTWFGETLYEKSYHLTAPSTANVSTNIIDTTDLNINYLAELIGSIKVLANTTHTGGNSFVLWARHNNADGNKIACNVSNASYLGGDMYVTLRYTKSS